MKPKISRRAYRSLAYLRNDITLSRKRKQTEHTFEYVRDRLSNTRIIAQLLLLNGRMSITEISRRTKIPVSTVHDYLKRIKEYFNFTIKPKHTSYSTESIIITEAGQTRIYDFLPYLKAS